MKFDLTSHNDDTLLGLKQKMIVELESFCNEKLSDTISPSDFKFFFKGNEIIQQKETISVEFFVAQVVFQ